MSTGNLIDDLPRGCNRWGVVFLESVALLRQGFQPALQKGANQSAARCPDLLRGEVQIANQTGGSFDAQRFGRLFPNGLCHGGQFVLLTLCTTIRNPLQQLDF